MFDLLGTKIGNFQKIILYLSNILTNTESVSLFPNRERRKFIAARNRQTSCRVVSVFCGYRRGGCCLFWLQRYPTTYDSEMGFGTTLSFLFMLPGCGWLKSLDYEKVIADDLFLVVLCAVLCANGTFDVQRSADRWQQTGICERIAEPRI